MAEIILLEVQEFISMMYGTFLRYYLPILKIDVLDEMSEDLIEIITSLTINGELSKWLLKLCRLSTREEEGFGPGLPTFLPVACLGSGMRRSPSG